MPRAVSPREIFMTMGIFGWRNLRNSTKKCEGQVDGLGQLALFKRISW
jgi:hypothetical protein